jgi:hypothetical protein
MAMMGITLWANREGAQLSQQAAAYSWRMHTWLMVMEWIAEERKLKSSRAVDMTRGIHVRALPERHHVRLRNGTSPSQAPNTSPAELHFLVRVFSISWNSSGTETQLYAMSKQYACK